MNLITLLVGQIIMPVMLNKLQEKILISFALVGCIVTLLPMALIGGAFPILCLARFFFGIF